MNMMVLSLSTRYIEFGIKSKFLSGGYMKKYYCPTCKRFKNRWQLKKEDDTRVYYFTCKWCHNSNIYLTEDILEKLIDKNLVEEDLRHRHGSWL